MSDNELSRNGLAIRRDILGDSLAAYCGAPAGRQSFKAAPAHKALVAAGALAE